MILQGINSVLEDSRTLYLANGERIKLPHTVNLVFEVQDLRLASPCTVSRCGVVHMVQGLVPMSSLVRSRGATTLKDLVRHLFCGLTVVMCTVQCSVYRGVLCRSAELCLDARLRDERREIDIFKN